MRSKEEAHDYRYFPEPDLPPVDVTDEWIAEVRASLPELPEVRKQRLIRDYALSSSDAGQIAETASLTRFFEATAAVATNAKAAANWVTGEVTRRLKQAGGTVDAVAVTPDALGRLLAMVDAGRVSASAAKDVFELMYGSGREAEEIVLTEGLSQIGDEAELKEIVAGVIGKHADAVGRFRAGNEGTLGFLVGQVMRATRGRATGGRRRGRWRPVEAGGGVRGDGDAGQGPGRMGSPETGQQDA